MRTYPFQYWFTLTILLFSNLRTEAKFSFSTLSSKTKHIVQTRTDSLIQANRFFKLLYNELEIAEKTFEIKVSKSDNLAHFQPTARGGIINFSTISSLHDNEAVFEEFFHAFQHLYYNLPIQIEDGGSNIEFEAKLFRAVLALDSMLPLTETPSQLGLLKFVLSLVNENGYFTKTHFSHQEQLDYIVCVQHFRAHWEKRNKAEKINNIYAQKVLRDWQPEALFFLIESLQ